MSRTHHVHTLTMHCLNIAKLKHKLCTIRFDHGTKSTSINSNAQYNYICSKTVTKGVILDTSPFVSVLTLLGDVIWSCVSMLQWSQLHWETQMLI